MKILIYDDNPDFGGHQIMACHGIEALASEPSIEVVFMYNPLNLKLVERLIDCPNLQTLEADPRRVQSLKPDLLLCIQGDIAQSTAAILTARKAGIECVSYIAIPHRLADMGAKLGGIRDIKNKPLFNKPDRFITISESMKLLLEDRGVRKPIRIVPNGIAVPPIPKLTAHDSRFTIGLISRIEFNQKQQDFFVHSFLKHPAQFKNCRVLMVGSGPDESKLKKLTRKHDSIALLPWQDNMEEIYEVIDMLVIPSRYEGVPLVMLEALARGVPVIGSRRDGMKDLLPQDWTFTSENSASLATTFSNVRKNWQQKIDELQNRVLEEHSLETFKGNFVQAVTDRNSREAQS